MMPTEMELRVARALHDHEWGKVQHSFDDGCAEYWVECARAAMRAMREPTEAMTRRGSDQLYGLDMDREDRMEHATGTFRAMIDAATSVEPEPRT